MNRVCRLLLVGPTSIGFRLPFCSLFGGSLSLDGAKRA